MKVMSFLTEKFVALSSKIDYLKLYILVMEACITTGSFQVLQFFFPIKKFGFV